MEKPLVSVIIPAYNCADYLPLAIDSALAQKVSLEVLVINDCSPEDLDSVMQRYGDRPEVRYLKNEKNMGVARTRNRGVELARGEYVAFLDADDYWAEGKLEKQLALIQEQNAVLCATGREFMTPEGKLTGRTVPVKTTITYRDMLRQNYINCSSALIRTEVAREFPMHHDDSHEDYIMWLEILQKYERACAVNEPLLKYRLSASGKSGSKLNSAKMTFKVYRYMGFGIVKSCACFCSYAVTGVWKHWLNRSRAGKGE